MIRVSLGKSGTTSVLEINVEMPVPVKPGQMRAATA